MRGQAYTLEAFVASMLVLSALVFALQSTAVTPLSSSTSSQHIENQEQSAASGALVAAAEADALKPAISTIDENGTYDDAGTDGAYVNDYPPGEFGAVLDRTFGGRGLAVAVAVRYNEGNNSQDSVQFVERGAPSDHAVTASRPVTIYNDDPLYGVLDGELNETGQTWGGAADPFNVSTHNGDSDVYNVVVVEVTVWRM